MRQRRTNKNRDYNERVLDIARVTRVVAGGKRLSFRALVAIGKKEGHSIGIGIAKGKDVAQAIEKATARAKKNLISVAVTGNTIPHEVEEKYKAAKIIIKPAREGRGIIAGGVVRIVLSLAQIPNISAKILGQSSNPINNARATVKALSKLTISSAEEKQSYADASNKTKS